MTAPMLTKPQKYYCTSFSMLRNFLFIFIFTHNQLEINYGACRNKDCE